MGATREMKESIEEWNQSKISREMQQKGIRWVFHPPATPHMSSVWERLVQSAKKHLKAIAGDQLLSEFALRTFLAEVEAVMNGRPLCAVSDDPADLEPLTPNHLLLQRKLVGLPAGIFTKEDRLGRRQWRKVFFWQSSFGNDGPGSICALYKKGNNGPQKGEIFRWETRARCFCLFSACEHA